MAPHVLGLTERGIGLGSPEAIAFAFIGVALFVAIGALSHAEERAFSASIIYLGLGIVASVALELGGIGQIVDPVDDERLIRWITEAAMIIALFGTGIRIRRQLRIRAWTSTVRLLLVAMPLTIAAVAAWGWGAMGLSVGAAIALGAALAPTDPVLAGDLGVRPPGEGRPEEKEQAQREPEFALTTEAGFNDGLALPFLVLGILIARDGTGALPDWAAFELAYASVAAAAVGAALGWGIGRVTAVLRDRGFLRTELDGWIGIAAPFAVYGAAESVGSYGFVAVFVAGVAFRRHEVGAHEYNRRVHDGAGVAKNFAELAVLLLVGSMFTLGGIGKPGATGWLLVPLLIFLIRPAAVFAALVGSSMGRPHRMFLAWFGVKGVASVNYLAIIAAADAFSEEEISTVVWTIVIAVLVSVFVHGVTATPLSKALLRGETRNGLVRRLAGAG